MSNSRNFVVLALCFAFAFTFTACNKGDNENIDPVSLIGGDGIFSIPFDTQGEVFVMMWAGSGEFLRDIGRRDISPEDIRASSDAGVIAVAKEFNKHFPNITINFYGRTGGDSSDGISWDQYRENVRMEHGSYPDVFAVSKLVSDVMRGIAADLSIFSDDPMYQAMNPTIMDLMTIDERLFGLPQYMIPWGIFVNRGLADRENIDIPPINWNINQFFQFANNSRANDFYGGMQTLWVIADSGTEDMSRLLANRGANGQPFVRINSEATRNILGMLPQMNPHGVWRQNSEGNISSEFMDEGGWWGPRFFVRNMLLTHDSDPWHFLDLANPEWNGNVLTDWDIYPRPSTNYVGNHVGIVLDPMAIRNYAMDDGNPVLSPSEYEQLTVSWEFAKFFAGDTRAWEARANQMYQAGDTMRSALNASFPFVTGQAFHDQMDIWFTAQGREALADPNRFPGFHRVIEIFLDGEFAAYSDKTIPSNYTFEGESRAILIEWNNKWSADYVGAGDGEPHWLDELFARLPGWEVEFNKRFESAFAELSEAVERLYPPQQRGGQ